MNAILAKYLKDFSQPEAPMPVEESLLSSLSGSSFGELEPDFSLEPAIDLEAEREAARQVGYDQAFAELREQHALEIERLSASHAEALAELQSMHDLETIGVIHARFHEMTQAIGYTLAEQTLQVLLPLINANLAGKAVAALAELVRKACVEEKVAAVVVQGPETLYRDLKPLLDKDGIESRHVADDTVDLTVEVNETVLLTRLSGWAQSLTEVME